MEQDVWSYYGLWGTVVLWILLSGMFLLFVPFYRPVQRKATSMFLAFAAAFALEMFGVPFSLYLVLWLTGRSLPYGVLWGHTLYGWVGMAGHYLYIALLIGGGALILAGWARIYNRAWSRQDADATLVRDGVYRYLRHPQYLGFVLISLGALLDWATIPLVVLWPILVRRYVVLARREDRKLAIQFRREWIEYAAATGGFLPRISVRRRG